MYTARQFRRERQLEDTGVEWYAKGPRSQAKADALIVDDRAHPPYELAEQAGRDAFEPPTASSSRTRERRKGRSATAGIWVVGDEKDRHAPEPAKIRAERERSGIARVRFVSR